MRRIKRRTGRMANRRRQIALVESLESRVLLSVIPVTDTGNMATNGTNLQNAINSAVFGDIIVLDANAAYLAPSGGFLLPHKTGDGTITIESSDIYDGLGNLPAGVRVGASVARYMPKLLCPGGNAAIIKTEITGSGDPTHGYAMLGLEMSPLDPYDSYTSGFVRLGMNSSAQNTADKVAHDFLIDRCYVHGLDPVSANVFANYKSGISINSAYTTIINSEISNIHTQIPDSQAVSGTNGTGHFTITNNFLEGSSECFIYGGGETFIPNNVPQDMTFTNNYLAKRISWNQYDPAFYDPASKNFGIVWNIKNLWEIKNFSHVLLDGNLMDNSWVSGDQSANAVLFTPKNQTSNGQNPWVETTYVTMTNNVIRYLGCGVQLASNGATDTGWYGSPTHDMIISNNVFYSLDSRTDGFGVGIATSRGKDGMWNITVEHNTFYNARNFIGLDSSNPYQSVVNYGYVVRDNVFQYGDRGLMSSNGDGEAALNTYAHGIRFTDRGAGYTSTPTVTFEGGGYTTLATATAVIDSATGLIKGIKITNRGAGYTSVPTIVISGGGATRDATAVMDANAIGAGGQLGDWIFTNNLVYGGGSSFSTLPAGQISSSTMDTAFIRDPAGELHDLLATSPGYLAGWDGDTCGVNPATLAPDFKPLDATATGYWKFDEGTGTTVSDSTGNGNAGTLSSGDLWTTSGNSYDAIALTGGTSGSVYIPNFNTTDTFSFAAWVKPADLAADSYIGSAGNSAFSLYVNSSGQLTATTSNGGSVTDATPLNVDTWYLVGCTYNSATGTLTLYRDGAAVASGATSGAIASGVTTLYIGGDQSSVPSFNGSIDEVRYWNSDMSELTFNQVTKMRQLFANYGPGIGALGPGSYTPVTGTTSTLSTAYGVSHSTYKGQAARLLFTWSIYDGPAGVTFGANNGTTTGKSCVATWPQAGVYTLQLVVTDPAGGTSVDIGHFVNVIQVPSSVSVSPASAGVDTGATMQFTNVNSGIDQFGNPLTGNWSWSVASGGAGGTIDPVTGLYYAPAGGGTDKINLSYNGRLVTTASTDADVTVSGSTLASVTVAATDSSASELWNNNGTYTFTRTGSTASDLAVNYVMSGATNGVDYVELSGIVVIPAGSASTTLTLTPIDDSLIEGAENAVLTIVEGTGYARGASNKASISIADAGDVPTITISADADAYEGGAPGVFTVTRSGTGPALTSSAIGIRYNISGTAANSYDYESLTRCVVIQPGQTSATINVNAIDDVFMEDTETVILTLASNSTYAIGSPSSATVNIIDNDTTPTVTVSASTPDASETGPVNGVFTVSRNGSTSGDMTVNFSIGGSASEGSDYSSVGTSVTIPDGSASATVTIAVIDDGQIEGSETAILTLAAGTGYIVGSPSSGSVTIADDDVPSITIEATTPDASETGPTDGLFTVTRNGSGPALYSGDLTVSFSVGGTASEGGDYYSIGTSVTIPDGQASATVTVSVIDDTESEPAETVILAVIGGTGYTVGTPGEATVTIADNDGGLIAGEDFNYTVGNGGNWNGGTGGTGWSDAWSVGSNSRSGIYSGSLSDPSGTLATSGNSAWLWKSTTASRTINYTLGQDGTSLWVGFLMRQHADGGTTTLYSAIQLGSDANNRLMLGSPWHNYYDGQSWIGGSRYYMPSSGISPVDDQTDFLVYRIDFGVQSGNASPDVVRLWVNPTPGTEPTDGSANSTWTLGTGVYFNFTDNVVRLIEAGYWTRTTFDELRFGQTYGDVAPVAAGGGMAPMGLVAGEAPAAEFPAPAANKSLSDFKAPAAAALAGPIAKVQASALKQSAAKIYRSPAVAVDDTPFDSLLASPLAGIKL